MATDYQLLFSGNLIEAQRICLALEKIDIRAIVKDQETSAIRAGFAVPSMTDAVQVFVHTDEFKRAKNVF
jgi:hypothetical protein